LTRCQMSGRKVCPTDVIPTECPDDPA